MAAHIGDPRRAGWDGRHVLQRPRQQSHAPLGQRAPQQHHEDVVVGQLALLVGGLAAAQIGNELGRRDDGLGLQQQTRRGDATQGAPRLQDGMRFGLVLAVGAQPLPHERHRVEPQHFHPLIGQKEDDVEHLGQHGRVAIVQIPLVLVERRPHPAVEVAIPGEVAWREVGEDLRQRALKGVRLRPVGVHQVVGLISRVAGGRAPRPLMLLGRVVADKVDAQANALGSQPGGHLGQIGHRAQRRVDGAIVGHGVAAVVRAVARGQQGHQVQVGDAQFGQVGYALGHTAHVAGEAVGVGHVAEHIGLLEPVGPALAALVEQSQLGRAGDIAGSDDGQQVAAAFVKVEPVAVEAAQRPQRVRPMQLQPGAEDVALQRRQFRQRPDQQII